ncbi:MAG TPA: pseudouridine synthase [Candidatus Limnocylindrales bacterium]|nr:pseudouridine synthase [Candidatus Limnocylindrales bacterium]
MMERLQKVLARAGIASRRESERLIKEGRVMVNSKIVTQLGTKVDPTQDIIQVDGKQISLKKSYHYLLLYKPAGYLTTFKTDETKPTLADLLPKLKGRVFPVGRLDFNSEGLVFLTDDGELAYILQHPKFEVPKTYEVRVHGIPDEKDLNRLSQGIRLEDGKTKPAKVRLLRTTGKNAWLQITIYEGKKRQVRRMCEAVGHPVSRLIRVALGPLTLQGLEKGSYRFLTPEEVTSLKKYVEKLSRKKTKAK